MAEWAVAIGDVAGHGLEAVADMAAARFSLRALALIDSQPDVVLDRLNQVVRVFENDALITVLYGVLDPHEHTGPTHPPVMCPRSSAPPTARTRFLDAPPDPPLGTARAFRVRQEPMHEGSMLVLYTDGLIERRGESLTEGRQPPGVECRRSAGRARGVL